MSTNRRQFLSSAVGGLVTAGATARTSRAWAQGAAPKIQPAKIKPGGRDVLLVVDVQNDFIPGGALPVKEGDLIVPLVNQIAAGFEHVIMTQDWHTPGHISFASAHSGKKPFETTKLSYGTQSSGRITACRVRPAPISTRTSRSPTPS
jgi:nicotinamidase/pyrazinamidase